MNATLTLVSDQEVVLSYLDEARKHNTQAAIAKHLGVGARTVRRWEARQTSPPAYLAHALQQLLPFGEESPAGAFDFIDLFAGIGGLRKAFEPRFSISARSEGDQEVEDVGEKPENVRKA